MKLPFDFGSKLILRLLLPGALLGGLALPAMLRLCHLFGIALDDVTIFAVASLVFGWLILLSDMPIYMLFEGRRYWPEAVREWCIGREEKRLARLVQRSNDKDLSKAQRGEYQVILTDGFPMTPAGAQEVRYPTRLGNLLTSFEEYPLSKYGLDGVFFWNRLWLAIDKDLRDELDNAQAVVDGALYLSMSFVIGAFILLLYAGLALYAQHWLPAVRVAPAVLGAGAVAAALCARGLYCLSLHGQRQYGELFKALFDQHRGKLEMNDLIEDLAEHFDAPGLPTLPARQRNMAAWRFLRWHRYRRNGASQVVTDWMDDPR